MRRGHRDLCGVRAIPPELVEKLRRAMRSECIHLLRETQRPAAVRSRAPRFPIVITKPAVAAPSTLVHRSVNYLRSRHVEVEVEVLPLELNRSVHFVDALEAAVLEFIEGGDAEVALGRACQLRERGVHEIQPRAVLWGVDISGQPIQAVVSERVVPVRPDDLPETDWNPLFVARRQHARPVLDGNAGGRWVRRILGASLFAAAGAWAQPDAFPVVTPIEQAQRDFLRLQILQTELAAEEAGLAEAAQRKAERTAAGDHPGASDAGEAVQAHRRNVSALRVEIEKVAASQTGVDRPPAASRGRPRGRACGTPSSHVPGRARAALDARRSGGMPMATRRGWKPQDPVHPTIPRRRRRRRSGGAPIRDPGHRNGQRSSAKRGGYNRVLFTHKNGGKTWWTRQWCRPTASPRPR